MIWGFRGIASPASIPPPTPLNAACAGYFDADVKAWTDAEAYAWNRDGHVHRPPRLSEGLMTPGASDASMRGCLEGMFARRGWTSAGAGLRP